MQFGIYRMPNLTTILISIVIIWLLTKRACCFEIHRTTVWPYPNSLGAGIIITYPRFVVRRSYVSLRNDITEKGREVNICGQFCLILVMEIEFVRKYMCIDHPAWRNMRFHPHGHIWNLEIRKMYQNSEYSSVSIITLPTVDLIVTRRTQILWVILALFNIWTYC